MELSAISKFWSELKTTVHPADAVVIDRYRDAFNLDYPSPAFTGDVLNARIIILMGNGGYKPRITDREYADPETADWQRRRLREPGPAIVNRTSPYYLSGERGQRLKDGTACVVNAVAYRSSEITGDIRRAALELPSAQFHCEWLRRAVVPLAANHRRAVIAHRWKLWGLQKEEFSDEGFFYVPPRPRSLPDYVWPIVDQWLDSAK